MESQPRSGTFIVVRARRDRKYACMVIPGGGGSGGTFFVRQVMYPSIAH